MPHPRLFPPVVTKPAVLLAGVGMAVACLTAAPADAGGGISPSSSPVATFDGYAGVRLGMTEEQATEVMGAGPREESHGCIILGPGDKVPVKAFFSEKTKHLNGLSTPPGTRTDRGVGDGSTVDEVKAAYEQYAIDEGPVAGHDGPGLNVYEGPKEFIAHRMLGFEVHPGGTVGPPFIGRPANWEGC